MACSFFLLAAWAGDFSRHAVPVFDSLAQKNGFVSVPSPDRSKVVIFSYPKDDALLMEVTWAQKRWKFELGPSIGAEMQWAPDSRAFFVTGSAHGRNGIYTVRVFRFARGRLEEVDLNRPVLRAFGSPVKCAWPEPPNISGIRWLDGSKELLVAAEIVHHSVCDSYGTFRLYRVDIARRRVLNSYGQLEGKKRFWDDLGEELRQANDECIRKPEKCWVRSNHR